MERGPELASRNSSCPCPIAARSTTRTTLLLPTFSAQFLFIAVRKSPADNSTTTSYKPRRGGAFFWLICLQDRAVLPSNVQTKRRRRGTHPRQSQHQSAPHQLPPASTPPVATPDHRTRASLNQRLIRLIDASKRLSRTTEIGMVLLHQFSMRLLDLSEGRVGLQAQHP